jgi:hypothetical protein
MAMLNNQMVGIYNMCTTISHPLGGITCCNLQRKRSNATWLVVSTPLKNMRVSWDDYFQYMENKKCLTPPTIYI